MKFLSLMCAVFLLMLSFAGASDDTNSTAETYNLIHSTNLAKPGCNSTCGDLIVPYPFGIGLNSNCSIDHGFDIDCNTSRNPPRASPGDGGYFSIKQISDSTLRTSNIVTSRCYFRNGTSSTSDGSGSGAYFPEPYTFSQLNKLTVIGCDDYVRLTSESAWLPFDSTVGGCMAFCQNEKAVADDCSGNGCCQSSIPKDIIHDYIMEPYTMLNANNTIDDRSFNHCTYAFIGDPNEFKFNRWADLNDTNFEKRIEATVPLVLEWAIGNLSCAKAKATHDFACQSNTTCVNSKRIGGGYRCMCKQGYQGNPYLSPGCQDIDECNNKSSGPCNGNICINTVGGYNCSCLRGYKGNAHSKDGCQRIGGSFPVMIFSLALVFGLVAIFSGVSGTFFGIRKRKEIKLREKCFEENGGLLLKQKLKALGNSDALIIYSAEQLRKATDNYSRKRVIGQGGHGVVYKGILSDNNVVAIKKSKVVNVTEVEQFINEVLILTQVIHPHVVKVLGCCLEEKVPVLVYEFISNKTLFYHIHHKSDDKIPLSWKNRLRVATEATSALAYLHSQTTMPIIHRDVKSSNILLDDDHTAKISDFGASRLISLDHDKVTTIVQGTVGYLDPEYLHTSKLTDKSDVYSFGVVLAELITGQKPLLAHETSDEKNLATFFVKAVNENRLLEIVDPKLLEEGTLEHLQLVGDLVKRCLNLHGNDRPTMKEVAEMLESFTKFKIHPSSKEQTREEIESSILEIVQPDHVDVPVIYSTSEYDYYSCSHSSTTISIQENKPR